MYNENIKKALRKYLRKVKKKLKIIYSTVKTKDILQKPERDAYSFFEENPQASFTDFEKEFGTPNEILDEFIDFNQVDKIIRRVIFHYGLRELFYVLLF